MKPTSWAIVPAALALALTIEIRATADEPKDLPPTPPAQQPKAIGERVGQAVDDAVQGVKRGVRNTRDTLKEEYQKARTSVHDMGVHSRVYSRLHWDKDLADAPIEVDFHEGVATLKGSVKTLKAKVKAATLARDTIGVERVDDHLTVETVAPGVVKP
jgi:osmotically-inducible protein OsmY